MNFLQFPAVSLPSPQIYNQPSKSIDLDKVDVRKRLNGLRGVRQCVEVSLGWLCVLSLQVLLLGSAGSDGLLVGIVGGLSGDDLSLAGGRLQVGGSNVELLSKDAAVDL